MPSPTAMRFRSLTPLAHRLSQYPIRRLTRSQSVLPRRNPFNMMSTNAKPTEGLFSYTSGRWLWDEESQFLQRRTEFNIDALKRVAARCLRADHCVSISKIAQGGFNRVFRLVMDNQRTLIAKFPYPFARSGAKTTASEVATMEFVRHTHLTQATTYYFLS